MSQVNDEMLYRLVIGNNPELAAVHRMTGSLDDILHARNGDTTTQSWLKYYLPSLERDGFTSETDYETKLFAEIETLEHFVAVNGESFPIDSSCGLTLVETREFKSHQDACSSIDGCTGWWRFTRIGYNRKRTQAMLHTDYDHPRYGLMGMGHFVLLEQLKGQWSVVAKDMTWIS